MTTKLRRVRSWSYADSACMSEKSVDAGFMASRLQFALVEPRGY